MTSKPGFSDRLLALDSLRAIAVIMVVLFHVATRFRHRDLDFLAQQFLRYGYLGVDIFYPLSGFLITSFLMKRQGKAAVADFFVRRIFRIVPLYFVAVLVFVCASLVTGEQAALLHRLWIVTFFLTGWFTFLWGPDAVPFTITWSISVEEFAYIVFGLATLWIRKQFRWFLIALMVGAFALRLYLNDQLHENIYYFPLARLDSVAAGGLVAIMIGKVRNLWVWLLLVTAVFLGMRLFAPYAISESALFSVVTFLSCAAIALCVEKLQSLENVMTTVLAQIGLYSYFVYLFHFFFIYGLLKSFRAIGYMPNYWIFSALALGVTLLAAHFSFTYFEAPLIRYGRKVGARLSSRPTA